MTSPPLCSPERAGQSSILAPGLKTNPLIMAYSERASLSRQLLSIIVRCKQFADKPKAYITTPLSGRKMNILTIKRNPQFNDLHAF